MDRLVRQDTRFEMVLAHCSFTRSSLMASSGTVADIVHLLYPSFDWLLSFVL